MILANNEHPLNALLPILVINEGIDISFIFEFLDKTLSRNSILLSFNKS